MASLSQKAATAGERPAPRGRDLTLWGALGLLALFLLTQYGDVRGVPFLNDDYIFLDKTRAASFGSLWAPKALAFHWYRPWSRELHYWTLQKIFGAHEGAFHVVSLILALAAMIVFFAFARRLAGSRVAAIAVAGWASLAAWAVPIVWVAGVQDLWMLLFAFLCLGAVAMERTWLAGGAFALALLSKESAAVLPGIALAYELLVPRRSFSESFRRTLPLWIVLVAWAAFHPLLGGRLWMPLEGQIPPAPRASLENVLGRTLLLPWNLDGWPRPEDGWSRPFLLGAAGALLLGLLVVLGLRARRETRAEAPWNPRGLAIFGGVWALLGLGPLFMPGLGWHNYYALLGAAGAWLAAAVLLARMPAVAIAMIAALVLLRAGRATTPSLDWGSEWYQRRAASFIGVMRADLMRSEPTVPPYSRLFFIRVPSYVGFLAGDGPALRVWYGDSTLRAGFYPAYRLRAPGQPRGEDYFFRFDSAGGWVRVVRGAEDIAQARTANPRWGPDHETLAQTLARAGDWPGALGEFEKLAAGDPMRVDYAYDVAVSWEAMGDSTRAGEWYQRAAALPGADSEVRAAAEFYARGRRGQPATRRLPGLPPRPAVTAAPRPAPSGSTPTAPASPSPAPARPESAAAPPARPDTSGAPPGHP